MRMVVACITILYLILQTLESNIFLLFSTGILPAHRQIIWYTVCLRKGYGPLDYLLQPP